MKSVTPLPPALSGDIITRPITLDRTLFYLVGGALSFLTDQEPLEQTGALTVEEAQEALSEMLWEFYHGRIDVTPIGGVIEYAGGFPLPTELEESGWLACIGFFYPISSYPDLYAVIGTTWNTGGEPAGTFRVPDLQDYSTMGAGSLVSLGQAIGEASHTLTTPEIPAHNHAITDPGHTHNMARSSSGASNNPTSAAGAVANAFTTASNTTGITIQNTGGGNPHNNIHPVKGMNKIIRAF